MNIVSNIKSFLTDLVSVDPNSSKMFPKSHMSDPKKMMVVRNLERRNRLIHINEILRIGGRRRT